MYKIVVFIPEAHVQKVKTAMFLEGGGRIGNYDSCSWETCGTGQFRPLKGSNPFLGAQDKVEEVKEYRMEMVCGTKEILKKVIFAMKKAHPYETPSYDVLELILVE